MLSHRGHVAKHEISVAQRSVDLIRRGDKQQPRGANDGGDTWRGGS